MHPELIQLPGGFSVKTYGFFMMIGFLSGVWLAMRRAARVKADPDVVLDLSLMCLIFGIAGARIFYVIHYWKSQFADAANPLFAIIDITSGGLEFLGGFLGAVLATVAHAAWRKYSLRLYLDIMAPSAMWGLGIGRIGCFFNGCCFGAIAATGGAGPAVAQTDLVNPLRTAVLHAGAGLGDDEPSSPPTATRPAGSIPWAVQFPYGSPAHLRHWEQRHVTVPAELIFTKKDVLQPYLVPEAQIFMPIEKREGYLREVRELEQAYKSHQDRNSPEAKKIRRELEAANKKAKNELAALQVAQNFPSRVNPQRETSVSELEMLAGASRSLPVHPVQLYATAGAVLLSLLLDAIFLRRKRHGVVIGFLLLLYPVQRTLEEIIRADNPQDVAGLTISQSISLMLFLVGLAYLYVLYTRMPLRSPRAVAKREGDAASA